VNNFSVIGYTTVLKIRPIKKAGFLNPAKPVYFLDSKLLGQLCFGFWTGFFVGILKIPVTSSCNRLQTFFLLFGLVLTPVATAKALLRLRVVLQIQYSQDF